ncbi:Nuclear receptor domain-containing protein [Aphelenchoides besseyi]|nr:Nuclear receptor domain-containing protein [Aphelenchoides besseyi]
MTTNVRDNSEFMCSVCDSRTRFHHLGTTICSSCSSFYRRSLKEKLQYRCEGNEKCRKGKGRYACRFCRFQACKELGARLPNDEEEQLAPPSFTLNNSPDASSQSTTSTSKQPILDNLVLGYELYLNAQRSLLAITHPEIRMSRNKVITLRKKEAAELRMKSTPLLIDMYNTHYGPFKKLKTSQKKKVASEVSIEFDILNCAYLTVKMFPKQDDLRLSFAAETYMDFSPEYAEWYFDGYIPLEELDGYLKTTRPMLERLKRAAQKYREIGMTKLDIVAMSFLIVYNRIDEAGLMDSEFVAYKEAMLQEWITHLKLKFGEEEGPQQMARLMSWYIEADSMAIHMKKVGIVQQVQMNSANDQLCNVTAYMQTLELDSD